MLHPRQPGAALITARFLATFRNQLVHVVNGCVSDDQDWLPFVEVGKRRYRHTSHELPEYQSLRGTSKVEVWHSVAK